MSAESTAWAWPWWTAMVAINALNLIACAIVLVRSSGPGDAADRNYRTWMRIMGVIFTLVGAYRSVFVSKYISQLAWFDSPANGALLIRSLAFFAEISFSGQIALAMLRSNRDLQIVPGAGASAFTRLLLERAPYVMWICIISAQVFATTGVITKSELSFAIEETLWSIGFLAILPLAVLQLRRAAETGDSDEFRTLRWFTRINLFWCVVYVGWGALWNMPLIVWPAAFAQMQTGLPAIQTDWSAVRNAFLVVHETKAWDDWGFGFVFWHSAYFSLCVWISIFLMSAPRKKG